MTTNPPAAAAGSTPGSALGSSTSSGDSGTPAGLAVLDREIYTESEAARLLRVAPGTLHYWLEGGNQRGRTYQPVIRVEPTGTKAVTWAEFVEAGLLRSYRRDLGVRMVELRGFIGSLRARLGVPYPLAHARPFAAGRELVWQAQHEVGLDGELALVAEVSGQYVLSGAADRFYRSVRWDGGPGDTSWAGAWRPDEREGSPVVIDPEIRAGRPSVGGISTSALWEQAQDGESDEELADTFGLTVAQVRWAVGFEDTPAA